MKNPVENIYNLIEAIFFDNPEISRTDLQDKISERLTKDSPSEDITPKGRLSDAMTYFVEGLIGEWAVIQAKDIRRIRPKIDNQRVWGKINLTELQKTADKIKLKYPNQCKTFKIKKLCDTFIIPKTEFKKERNISLSTIKKLIREKRLIF